MRSPACIHTDSYEGNSTALRGRMWEQQQQGEGLNKPATGMARGRYEQQMAYLLPILL